MKNTVDDIIKKLTDKILNECKITNTSCGLCTGKVDDVLSKMSFSSDILIKLFNNEPLIEDVYHKIINMTFDTNTEYITTISCKLDLNHSWIFIINYKAIRYSCEYEVIDTIPMYIISIKKDELLKALSYHNYTVTVDSSDYKTFNIYNTSTGISKSITINYMIYNQYNDTYIFKKMKPNEKCD